MPERKYPISGENPAARLTDRIAYSLRNDPSEDREDIPDGESKAALGRIDTYLYWNAFDHDRPK